MTATFWKGRKVLLTGHTGFMGGWLAERLLGLGADVTGFSLPAPTTPSLFEAIGLARRMRSIIGDVRDLEALTRVFAETRPECLFHLAAQPLVRRAHREPIETFSTNFMGSVHVLEAARKTGSLAAAIMVTTDKVYDNREWEWGYRENDTLGGHEPYGVSKACAELAVNAYVRSYFKDGAPDVATIRAGNIVGGGDWAEDRLVPDAVRAFAAGRSLGIRHPDAVRPWQHVLEPVGGMMLVAQRMTEKPGQFGGAWNFGPAEGDARPVAWIADRLAAAWGDDARWETMPAAGPHEARLLTLSSTKAATTLGWRPKWNVDTTLTHTARWYRAFYDGADMASLTRDHVNAYFKGENRGEFKRQGPEEQKRAVA